MLAFSLILISNVDAQSCNSCSTCFPNSGECYQLCLEGSIALSSNQDCSQELINSIIGPEIVIAPEPTSFKGMYVGDGILVGGVPVTLTNVGSSGAIVIDVDGVQDTLNTGVTREINCIPITNEDFSYVDLTSERRATINIGDYRDPNCDHFSGFSDEQKITELSVDGVVFFGGRELSLKNVGSSGAIVIDVDGVQDTLNTGVTREINCIPIFNVGTSYSDLKSERKSTINVGDDRSQCGVDDTLPISLCNNGRIDAETFEEGIDCGGYCDNACPDTASCFINDVCELEYNEDTLNCGGDCFCGDGVCDGYENSQGICATDCAGILEVDCTDSDGGENYYIKGNLTLNYKEGGIIIDSLNKSDVCSVSYFDNETNDVWRYRDVESCSAGTPTEPNEAKIDVCGVNEWVCDYSTSGGPSDLDYFKHCPNGCFDGACIADPQQQRETPPFTIAISDPYDDFLAVNIVSDLIYEGYSYPPIDFLKFFSEINPIFAVEEVILAIYEREAVIITGTNSPPSHSVFATDPIVH